MATVKQLGETVTLEELATYANRTLRTLQRWVAEPDSKFPAAKKSGMPTIPALLALIARLAKGDAEKTDLAAERLLKTREERLRLERERMLDEKEHLSLAQWRHLIGETIPPIRQGMKVLLCTELPSKMAGRSEVECRKLGRDSYNRLVGQLRGHEEKFEAATEP